MLSLDLALALRDRGLVWQPVAGDRFVVPDRDLDDQVFLVSPMVVELREVPDGPPVMAFNGTTEWALDSLQVTEAVWLPREDQLRALLGEAFVSLERLPGEAVGYAVTLALADVDAGVPQRHVDVDAESALARALLAVGPTGRAPR
ncbi:pilus assembly protein CpaE [Nocardioides taihuensis]|uniref:Pilus assembly protein CpaE n=1 Tax=Nocardioides taihuensis TaxID=1835606 RepID=A0ABW0BF97_9ACTN